MKYLALAIALLFAAEASATVRVQRVVVRQPVVRQRVVVQRVVAVPQVQQFVAPVYGVQQFVAPVQQFNGGCHQNGALQFNAGGCSQLFTR